MKYLSLALKYPWLGWVVAILLALFVAFRPPKIVKTVEYKDRIVYRSVSGSQISGSAKGGKTTVTPDGVVNEGGEVDWSASSYDDSGFIEDTVVTDKETVSVPIRPAVFVGPSVLWKDALYIELGGGLRVYKAVYIQGGVGTKRFTGLDSYRAGMFIAF